MPPQSAPRLKVHTEKTSVLVAKVADYNPRVISAIDMEALERSLGEFGVVQPVIVNRATDKIVGGHQRVMAAARAGIAEMPVIYVDLTPDKEIALNLALNRIQGDWDTVKLGGLLRTMGDDMRVLSGFTEVEVADLLSAYTGGTEQNRDPHGAGDGEGADESAPTVFSIVFNSTSELEEWYEQVRSMREAYPEIETISGRLLARLRDCG